MALSSFELDALRFFGSPLPVAVVRVDGNPQLYDLDGIKSLMRSYHGTSQYAVLADIERQMLVPGNYSDIQDSDFSGQDDLFGGSE